MAIVIYIVKEEQHEMAKNLWIDKLKTILLYYKMVQDLSSQQGHTPYPIGRYPWLPFMPPAGYNAN